MSEKTKAQKGKQARRSGHQWERDMAQMMRNIGYSEARRGLQYQDGFTCCDVEGTPFHIECKAYNAHRARPLDALIQATDDNTNRAKIPGHTSRPEVVALKLKGFGSVVVMWLGDWLDLAEKARGK